MESGWKISVGEVERLHKAIQNFPGNAEEAINEELHGYAGELLKKNIRNLMPVSGKNWKGKKPGAKKSQHSLTQVNSNLAVAITARGVYGYLYFPDDGSNTLRHAGNQHFFWRGCEASQDDIIERCVARLTQDFEKGE